MHNISRDARSAKALRIAHIDTEIQANKEAEEKYEKLGKARPLPLFSAIKAKAYEFVRV